MTIGNIKLLLAILFFGLVACGNPSIYLIEGEPGPQGPAGPPGLSCNVIEVEGGALITCGSNQVLVLNGADGQPGTSVTFTTIDPCGDAPGVIDELLFAIEGAIYALVVDNSGGKNPRLAALPPGSYITTDGTNCLFSVDSEGRVHD